MALMLETPSRIWRRIEADDGQDMPSLPSLPPMDDSADNILPETSTDDAHDDSGHSLGQIGTPIHSTPAVSSHASTRTFRGGISSSMKTSSNASSATRFANSIARSSRSSIARSRLSNSAGISLSSRHGQEAPDMDSFDISAIPSLPDVAGAGDIGQMSGVEMDSVDDLSDALESVSRASSPFLGVADAPGPTPDNKKTYTDYLVKLKSEPKPSPFDKDRFRNIVTRRPVLERTRTPSLTHTTGSPASSPTNSTPHSIRSGRSIRHDSDDSQSQSFSRSLALFPLPPASIPLPRSNSNSPMVFTHRGGSPDANQEEAQHSIASLRSSRDENDTQSMDITDAHISPVRRFDVSETESISERSTEEVRDMPKPNREHGERHDETSSTEPTFSSESESQQQSSGPASPSVVEFSGIQGFSGLREELSQFSSASISPSLALATPTPAFPRPRARFGLPSPRDALDTPRPNTYTGSRDVEDPSENAGDQKESRNSVSVPEDDIHASRSSINHDETQISSGGSQNEEHDDVDRTIPANRHDGADEDDLLTPHTRRRSFLLSVINSTARPRPRFNKFPTPHPTRPRTGTGNLEEKLIRNRGRESIGSVTGGIEDTPIAPVGKGNVRFGGVINGVTETPVPATPGIASSLPTATPGLRTAFAGATPRPRFSKGGAGSHPLAQAFTANSSATSDGTTNPVEVSPGQVEHESIVGDNVLPWVTPAPGKVPSPFNKSSPYLSANINANDAASISFISTASSHDLTTHPRANTSFDPALGFGGTGTIAHGVGRFNAGKLNNYLHGLNRRLQEENEKLVERLKRAEEQVASSRLSAASGSGSEGQSDLASNLSSASARSRPRLSYTKRRISAGSALGDVKEEDEGSGSDTNPAWAEERAELEALIEVFKSEVDARALEKGVLERAVEVERAGYVAEKEEMERVIEEAKRELEALLKDKEVTALQHEAMIRALEQEREDRARDKERWKERMGEVEQGVESIVHDLEKRLADSEARARKLEVEMDRRVSEAEVERDEALERERKATEALDSGKELGGELREANERLNRLMGQLRRANARVEELEGLVSESDERVEKLEGMLRDSEAVKNKSSAERKAVETELQNARADMDAMRLEVRHLEELNVRMEEELKGAREYVAELEENAGVAVGQIEDKEREINEVKSELERLDSLKKDLECHFDDLEKERDGAKMLARQMEEALEAAQHKMLVDDEESAKLRGRIATLEQEKDRQRELSSRSMEISKHTTPGAAAAFAEIEALEEELNDANKEIARLNTVLSQSPARRAMDKAKDVRIEMLEKENEALTERIKVMRLSNNEATMAMNTSSKFFNTPNISPIHRQVLAMSLKTPKTPGGPLRDMSWLNSTFADSGVTPLVAEISRLQRELDRANESIDDKLDKLEDAGLGVVGLTKELEDARSRIKALEEELARLSRREERRLQRLQRARCQKCLAKVDLRSLQLDSDSFFETSKDSLPSEPPTPPTKTSDALRANLRSVNAQLAEMKEQWGEEKAQLQSERAVLQDAANRLNVQVRQTREEVDRALENRKVDSRLRQDLQNELEKAKLTISSLEENLKVERSRLRGMTTEQNRITREKEEVLLQLKRTESDMEEVKEQLQNCKKENRELENELRHNANAEQKARLLENRFKENTDTMEQLREERALLVAEHKELQKKFSQISEQAQHLREQQATSQQTHDNRRQQLDLHLAEIEELRQALSDRASDLKRAEVDKAKLVAESDEVARTVAALESDLRRVKRDAEAFGRDLKLLRAEKEKLEVKQKEETAKAERIKKQMQTQLRLLNEQLDEQRTKTLDAQTELKNHACAMDNGQVANLKLQHSKECKGLIVQIRYLKAKFTRESILRFDLAYQKQYLLVLLAQFEKSEQTIFAAIARLGFPELPAPSFRKRRKLKSIGLLVVFLARIRRASAEWKSQSASKQAVAAALQEVRQRRAAANTS
ncbi:hypothetical protein Moror_16258 [Moniliophthora roreri MCA 2997]|uniref:Pericentrin/AKAP-450 centrosomal targeting domain-containing protein n=1 Tax=Moniliophthora roreri (strain MCA 2997) TaxID=1381753 RepID=V2XA33_MONRO|nr:hypothetical protein Moror_16258 [Moniliophthora roreri MCA 2997]